MNFLYGEIMGKGLFVAGKYSSIVDAVAISHAVVANAIMISAVFTDWFVWVTEKYAVVLHMSKFAKSFPGILYVYEYVDLPIYRLMGDWVFKHAGDPVASYAIAEVIILLSSLLYSLIAYAFLRMISAVAD